MGKERVAIVGSGNWGSAISKLVGENVKKHANVFEQQVKIWVFDEQVEGRSLVETFNEKHENVKYLPGRKLPENIIATGDLVEAIEGATALIFVLPHQFIPKTCQQMQGKVGKGAKGISLIKGVEVKDGQISIFADVIEEQLGVSCSALSGANIADEVADESFSETTIGYRKKEDGEMWKKLFHTQHFRVSLIDDVDGVSLCGALKNIVAIAVGFSDGLGLGSNAKAAIMRIGLMEMKSFSQEFFENVKDATFVSESAGVADLITSCISGRNRKVADAFAKTGKPFKELEQELLNGQKLQGTETAKEVYKFLEARNRVDGYPLFRAVYQIVFDGKPVKNLTEMI